MQNSAEEVDTAWGCVAKELTLSSDPSTGKQTGTITFICQPYTPNDGTTYTGLPAYASNTVPTGRPCKFGLITAAFHNSTYDDINAYSLTVTNEFIDDQYSFGTSETKNLEAFVNWTGTYSVTVIYDELVPLLANANIISQDITDGSLTLSLPDASAGANTILLTMTGQIMSTVPTGSEKGIYIVQVECKMAGTAASSPFKVTFTDAT